MTDSVVSRKDEEEAIVLTLALARAQGRSGVVEVLRLAAAIVDHNTKALYRSHVNRLIVNNEVGRGRGRG